MTECPNCHSKEGVEKDNIWKCKVCNGEHKINLKTQGTTVSHAKRTDDAPTTIKPGEIPAGTKPETS